MRRENIKVFFSEGISKINIYGRTKIIAGLFLGMCCEYHNKKPASQQIKRHGKIAAVIFCRNAFSD
jgi:hypothetical protein